ncbi:uncharacterized protein NEMAJ01_0539 [Nematocida major]|uniref:uncharacterized protein n=1 Tax=Nematocida major TaxID=1912982 RepID=UPI002008D996|nr:uncharacterized protein NEMAJ01_0539 [Nematocida major]KAH9385643.1 hypothetical protein NEMAJ01_0539 [Nematocida major]
MRANDLLEMRERIKGRLCEEEKRRGENLDLLKKIEESLQQRTELCQRLQEEATARADRVNMKQEALARAKEIVAEKENSDMQNRRRELAEEFEGSLNRVNKVELVLSKEMTSTVERILAMGESAKKSGFMSLFRAVHLHLMNEMKEFIRELKNLSGTIRVDMLVGLAKALNRSIIMADRAYLDIEARRRLYVDVLFAEIEESFSHHFFGGFETNRLDKPEWYMDYLLSALSEHDKIFSVLSHVDELAAEIECDEFERENKKKYFSELIGKIYAQIVFRKLNECVYSDSRQKKELIMHHVHELKGFQRKLQEAYGCGKVPSIPEKDSAEIQRVFIESTKNDLMRILGMCYSEWSEHFLELLKKAFKQSASIHLIIPNAHALLLEEATSKYLECLSAFLNSFLYQKDEEQKILVHFIEEAVHLEEELLNIETEFGTAVGEITILEVPYLEKFKGEILSILERVVEEKIESALKPLVSYRFMESAEHADAMSCLADTVQHELSLSEMPEVTKWMHSTIGKSVDEYLSREVLSSDIDNVSDVDIIRSTLDTVSEIFKEYKVEYALSKSKKRHCELLKSFQ